MGSMTESLLVVCGRTLSELSGALPATEFQVVISEADEPVLPEEREAGDRLRLVLLDAAAVGKRLPQTLQRLSRDRRVRPLVVGAEADPELIVRAIQAGAADYIVRDRNGRFLAELPDRLRRSTAAARPGPQEIAQRFAQLMASMQHDVKNPVNNILGYVELLSENPTSKLGDDQAQFLRRIVANCTMILDILQRFEQEAVRVLSRD